MQNFFSLLIQVSIISSTLIIFVLVINRLLSSSISLKITIFLWIIVLIRLLIPVFINTNINLYSFIPTVAAEKISNVIDDTQMNKMFEPDIVPIESMGFDNDPSETIISNNSFKYLKKISVFTYAMFIWCIGALVSAFKKLYAGFKFTKMIAAEEIGELNNNLDVCKRKLKYSKKVTIKKSKYIAVPITYGIFRPAIILPERLIERLEISKLQLILLHELSHIKRKDILRNYIWLIAKIIHWFNPLVYIAYRRYLMNVELACDQKVVANIPTEQRYEYSQTLLDVIMISGYANNKKIPSIVAFCENNTKIGRRLDKMLNIKKQKKSTGIITVIFALILAFLCFTTACLPSQDINNEAESIAVNDTETKEYTLNIEDHNTSNGEYEGIVLDSGTGIAFSKDDDEVIYYYTIDQVVTIVDGDLAELAEKASAKHFDNIDSNAAIELATEYLLESKDFIDEDYLKNTMCCLTSFNDYAYGLVYMVRFEYYPDEPTEANYSFTANVFISSNMGDLAKIDFYEK
ncbi:MAG: M56 family metallopeptidase [Eubacteriales bacterium]